MTTFKKTHKRKVKNLVKRQLPEFVLADHPKFAEFISSYYLFLESAELQISSFTSVDNNYELKVYSCPGSNSCSSSSINTHKLADRLSYLRYNKIHISGSKKGCALSKPADLTQVGNNGLIDVIFNGKASDKPNISSLTDKQLLENL